MSLPMMTQTTSKAIESNIVQEAIFATGAILNESTTYYWDSHSMDDANTTSDGYSRVVNTGDCLGGGIPYKRVGHINRRCLDNNTTAPNAVGDSTSIEWAGHIYNNIKILTGTASAATYKDEYSATITVRSCSGGGCVQFGDGTAASNNNLKEIDIVVTPTGSANVLVRLRAYVANIGEVAPKSEIF